MPAPHIIMRAIAAIAAAFILQASASATQQGIAMGDGPINPIIGDRSFIERFGHAPTGHDNDQIRIATHLAYVERLLRERDTDGMPAVLRTERFRNLDRLRDYVQRGAFPHNYDHPGTRRPCFIDHDGTICAVGYLVEQSAGRATAEAINQRFQYTTIEQMNSPELQRWVTSSGLTEEEAAMIQPAYEFHIPPTLLIGVSAGTNIVLNSGMRPPDELRDVVTPANTSIALNPLVGLAGIWYFTRDREHMLMARVSYDDRSFTHLAPASDITVLDRNGETRNLAAQYQINSDYKLISTDLLYGYKFEESSLALLAGPSLGVVLSEERLDARVPESGFASAYLLEAPTRPLRVGIKAGLQYTLRSRYSLWLTPTILYDFGLTTVKNGESWRSHALQIGIDFQFPIDEYWGVID